MRSSSILSMLGAAGLAAAQRPSDTPICDYYTTALLKNNTAANQYTLLTLVVNTAVIGNYTKPNVGISVPGILAKGTYNGTEVDLLPYFNGMLASTNGGDKGVSVNFLDGGAATPIMNNMPANSTDSNQHKLLTHLYEYFGALLGCSQYGSGDAFPAYGGSNSMYKVHKFMDLSAYEVGYFVQQVGLSAASFGVAKEDIMVVANALSMTFGYKCAPEAVVIPSQPAALQAICIGDACPLSANATCASYQNVTEPLPANGTMTSGSSSNGSSSSGMPSGTSTMSPAQQTANAGAATAVNAMLGVAGVAAFIFAL